MNAGRLNARATLLEPVNSRAANGEQLTTWQVLGTRWAAVKALSGQEAEVANAQVQASQTLLVRMRYDTLTSALTAAHRLLLNSQTLLIVAPPENVGLANREIQLRCVMHG